ncbi:MAG: hypothetical protein L6R41_003876, partial [Letrouitia leprolyta]
MASRGTYGTRATKSAEKEREKSRIPMMGLSRKSSVTSTSSNTSKAPSSSMSWFSRGKRKQAATQPAPTMPTSLSTAKKSGKSSDETSFRSDPLARRRQAIPSDTASSHPLANIPPSNHPTDNESRRHNVLRRKPSLIGQRSRYAHTEPSATSEDLARARPEDALRSRDTYSDRDPDSVFGVALPTTSVSSSHLPTHDVEPSYQATSSSRMADYNTNLAPKTPTPQLLPPLAPSFANSSGSSTRRSESPGAFSRTSTPTSISSYSPGIPITSKSPLRARQISPTRSRPPVTRNRHGNGSKQDLGVEDTRGLSMVQEMATSSSSSDTVRGNDRSAMSQKGNIVTPASASQSSSYQSNIPKAGHIPLAARQHYPSETHGRQPRKDEYPHESSHDSFAHVAASASQLPSKTPPPRPSREGTPRLENVQVTSPVIRSNLSRLETTGHKRRESWGRPIVASPYESQKPSSSQSNRTISASGSSTKLSKSSRLPSPNPVATGPSRTWPTDRPGTSTQLESRSRAANRSREPSPVSARATKSRFGLFSRRVSPSRTCDAENLEKHSKKGPAAGTGHEGYGKYARRGRSGSTSTSVSRGRSTSSNATAGSTARTSNSRKSSMTAREEPEIDDFLRDRLSPVVITGGRVSVDRNSGAELYRTTSGASSASIAASDDSSLGRRQSTLQQPTGGFPTMVVNSTISSRRSSRSLPRSVNPTKSANNSDTEDYSHLKGHTLEAR